MLHTRAFFFYFCFFLFATTAYSTSQVFQVIRSGDTLLQEFKDGFPAGLILTELSYESDVFFSKEEFRYLVDFKIGSKISFEQIERAITNIKKKNRFESVEIQLRRIEKEHYHIHFTCVGFWTFNKVKFDGVFLGKEAYRHLYAMEQGEQFDIQKHNDFINVIQQALASDGYLHAQVKSYQTFDHNQKLVTAYVSIIPNALFKINDVRVQCDQMSLDDELRLIAQKIQKKCEKKLSKGAFSQRTINQETQKIKDYLARKGYLNPRIELLRTIDENRYSVDLIFQLNVSNQRRFIFFGNQFFSKRELIDHCLTFGRSIEIVPLSIIGEELDERYHEKGFWQHRIEIQQESNRIYFLINEGQRATLSSVQIDGALMIDNQWLSKKFFKGIKKKVPIDLIRIKEQTQELMNWYRDHGFSDVQVLKEEFLPTGYQNEYKFCLTLHEGIAKTIESVFIEGIADHEQEKVARTLKNKEKKIFSYERITDDRKQLLDYFQSRGFLYAQIKAEIVHHHQTVSIIWHVTAGKQITFGKTILQGATNLPFQLLEKNFVYQQGQYWNKELVRETFLKLRDLDIFETIYVHGDRSCTNENEKAILLKLVHDDPYEVRVRAGFQQVSRNFAFRNGTTYKLGGSLLIKNPFHRADSMRLDVDVTRFYRNVAGTYKKPWFPFGYPVNLILKGYNSTYMQPIILGSAKPLYQARQQGGMIGLSYFSDKKEWGINTGVELLETNHLSVELARAINFEPVLIDKMVPYAYLEPNLFIDALDNKANPSIGSLTVVSCKGMAPFNRNGIPFLKVLIDQSIFFPVWHTIFGIHVRLGNIFTEKFPAIMPIDRFYLGGEMSLRGYLPDLAPPLGIYIDDHEKKHLVPQGGRFVFNANLEIRFPIPLVNRLWGALFEDIGVLVSNGPIRAIDGNALLGSTGFGLRYLTPIGPLRFDVGWKWRNREPEQNSYAAWFTLGNAF